jgi:hypothetical protein
MMYLLVYCIFAYLIVLGQILGELMANVTPNRWQLLFFIVAPLFFPVFVGFWMCQVMNIGEAKQQQVTHEEVKVKIKVTP